MSFICSRESGMDLSGNKMRDKKLKRTNTIHSTLRQHQKYNVYMYMSCILHV